jgi:hypothetical protein
LGSLDKHYDDANQHEPQPRRDAEMRKELSDVDFIFPAQWRLLSFGAKAKNVSKRKAADYADKVWCPFRGVRHGGLF